MVLKPASHWKQMILELVVEASLDGELSELHQRSLSDRLVCLEDDDGPKLQAPSGSAILLRAWPGFLSSIAWSKPQFLRKVSKDSGVRFCLLSMLAV